MRIAVIIVAMSVVIASSATPSDASQACMSKAEARHQFASVHIYWHGRGHCWDATPAQRHRIGRIKGTPQVREAQRKAVQPRAEQPEWREARSEMLADDGPAPLPPPPQGTGSEETETAAAVTPWALRWVDVEPALLGARAVETAPVAPSAFTRDRDAEPLFTLHSVVFMCIAFVLTLGTIKILVVALISERRRAGSNYADRRDPRMG
jgi:hypothetical protein